MFNWSLGTNMVDETDNIFASNVLTSDGNCNAFCASTKAA